MFHLCVTTTSVTPCTSFLSRCSRCVTVVFVTWRKVKLAKRIGSRSSLDSTNARGKWDTVIITLACQQEKARRQKELHGAPWWERKGSLHCCTALMVTEKVAELAGQHPLFLLIRVCFYVLRLHSCSNKQMSFPLSTPNLHILPQLQPWRDSVGRRLLSPVTTGENTQILSDNVSMTAKFGNFNWTQLQPDTFILNTAVMGHKGLMNWHCLRLLPPTSVAVVDCIIVARLPRNGHTMLHLLQNVYCFGSVFIAAVTFF